MPTSAADSHPVPGQTSPEPRVQPSEQLEAHASEQLEAQAFDEGPVQEIFLDEVKAGCANNSFLAKPNSRRNSARVPPCVGTRIAHYMCQRVELSESSASVMYMITPAHGMQACSALQICSQDFTGGLAAVGQSRIVSGHVKHANAVNPLYFKKAGMLQPTPIAGRP